MLVSQSRTHGVVRHDDASIGYVVRCPLTMQSFLFYFYSYFLLILCPGRMSRVGARTRVRGPRITRARDRRYRPPTVASVTPPALDTRGGTLLTCVGGDFGARPVVYVGGSNATVVSVSSTHSLLTATAPPGVGHSLALTIAAGGQAVSAPAAVAYNAPSVSSVEARGGYVDGVRGARVTLRGSQFGPPGTPAAVTVEGYTCTGALIIDDATCTCTLGVSLVATAAARVVLSRAGQDGTAAVRIACPPGYARAMRAQAPTLCMHPARCWTAPANECPVPAPIRSCVTSIFLILVFSFGHFSAPLGRAHPCGCRCFAFANRYASCD